MLMLTLCTVSTVHATTTEGQVKNALSLLKRTGITIDKSSIVILNTQEDTDKVTSPTQKQVAMTSNAFVIGNQFPIYINAWADFWEHARQEPQVAVDVMIAGILAHERIHAAGDTSETAAYAEELRVVRKLATQNKVDYALSGWISQTERFLEEEKLVAGT